MTPNPMKKKRPKNRHVVSFAFDKTLIADLDYYFNTLAIPENRSRAIERVLRVVIPQRNLSITSV